MLKKNLIAVALATALVSPSAFAAKLTSTATTPVNSNQFVDDDATFVLGLQTIAATASDNYLGRTVGYNVRVKLSAGTVASCGTIGATGGAVSATVVSGTCVAGATEFVVNVVPSASGTQVGEGFTITDLTVTGLGSIGTAGQGSIKLSGKVYDPTTAIELPGSDFNGTAQEFKQGLDVVVTAKTSPNKVDVGTGKVFFTSSNNGAVGTGDINNIFNAGTVEVKTATGVDDWLAAAAMNADITVRGTDFTPFENGTTDLITLASDSTCATTVATGVVSADKKSATFEGVDLSTTAETTTFNVCFASDEVAQISAQGLMADVVVNDTATHLGYEEADGTLASIAYNGAVAKVWHFNPASNADQVSYLRLTNTSTTDGKVTIEATCDDGTSTPNAAVITSLGAGKSVLLTSSDLEQGKRAVSQGYGVCAGTNPGKLRLVLTGEFGSMQVQNFLRNNTSAGTINTNVNIEDNNQTQVN